MGEELKPCPFCGAPAISDGDTQILIQCSKDCCDGVLIEEWQARATEQQQAARIAELEAASSEREAFIDQMFAVGIKVTEERDQLKAVARGLAEALEVSTQMLGEVLSEDLINKDDAIPPVLRRGDAAIAKYRALPGGAA